MMTRPTNRIRAAAIRAAAAAPAVCALGLGLAGCAGGQAPAATEAAEPAETTLPRPTFTLDDPEAQIAYDACVDAIFEQYPDAQIEDMGQITGGTYEFSLIAEDVRDPGLLYGCSINVRDGEAQVESVFDERQ